MQKSIDLLNQNIDNNSTVVVACSGGPDSMCLLSLLHDIKSSKNLKIIVAHVDHNIREESHDELLFVEDYAKSNGDIFISHVIDKKINYNESDYRIIRYDFFRDVIKKYDAKYLLTAHHGDDLIETILMRIVRGSNLNGYSGFKSIIDKHKYKVLRPLVFVTKDDILAYNEKSNIPFVVDKTNDMDKYTRNRYRHHLLPFLKNEDRQVHKKFLKYSKELQQYETYFNELIDKKTNELFVNNKLVINNFLDQEPLLRKKILEKMLADNYQDDLFVINDGNLEEIIKCISNNNSNGTVFLPNNYIGIKDYDYFYIEKNKEINPYKIELKDELLLDNGYIIKRVDNSNEKSNYVIRLNSKDILLPLSVRTREDGDFIEVKNLNGRKKVKDILIDEKISIQERDSLPLVVDSNNNVLWIPGLKKSKFDKEINEIYDIILECKKEKEYEQEK